MNKVNKINIFDIIIMFCLVGIVPWLVLGLKYSMPLIDMSGNIIEEYDYFNYIKVVVINIIALIIVLYKSLDFLTSLKDFYIMDRIKKAFNKTYFFVCLILCSLFISYIFSEYKEVAKFGAMERFESIWTHMSYMIIFVYSISFFKKEDAFKYFSYSILLSSFIVGLIGTLQFINIDPFSLKWIQDITTFALKDKDLTFDIVAEGSFTTMYNTNTSASYALLMIFMLLVIYFIYDNLFVRIVSCVNLLFIFITFYNSFSEASYIALAGSICFLILLILILLVFKKQYKIFKIAISTCAAILAVGIIFIVTNDTVKNKLATTLNSVVGEVTTFTDWEQIDNEFLFYNKNGEYIKIIALGDGFEIYENEKMLLSDKGEVYKDYQIQTESFGILEFENYMYNFDDINYIAFNEYFSIRNNDTPAIVNSTSFAELERTDFIGFEGYGNLFTNRGFIWSKSLAMLVNRPIGYGSDVYFMVFPNQDVVGKWINNQPMDVFIDKPHSIYLNMAINNGVLYLIGFIGIVVVVLTEKLKLLFKEYDNVNVEALICFITGIIAYLINGIATDNLVIIIVIFWIYLAISSDIFKINKNN